MAVRAIVWMFGDGLVGCAIGRIQTPQRWDAHDIRGRRWRDGYARIFHEFAQPCINPDYCTHHDAYDRSVGRDLFQAFAEL